MLRVALGDVSNPDSCSWGYDIGHEADRLAEFDPDKLMNKLGWKPLENFTTGIRRTVQWYLDNEWWWGPIHAGRYLGQRLGTGRS